MGGSLTERLRANSESVESLQPTIEQLNGSTNVGSRTGADRLAATSIAGQRAVTSEAASKSQRAGPGVPGSASKIIAETSSSSAVWHG
jgi:hypothetical protein